MRTTMWSNDESSSLILTIEKQFLTSNSVTSMDNNREFTGNLVDIVRDWDQIANKLNHSGECVDKEKQQKNHIMELHLKYNRLINICIFSDRLQKSMACIDSTISIYKRPNKHR